jgi:WD40 repeat protein
VVQVLQGHAGCVFDVEWNERRQVLVTGGEDATVRTWEYDPSRSFFRGTADE